MDFNLKQWKEQHESEDQHQQTAKLPRLLFHSNPHSHTDTHSESPQALPLFVTPTKLPPDHSLSRYASPGMGASYFSSAQWQELEVQALIFRHMLSGAAIPAELLHLVKKSLFTSSAHPYYFSHLQAPPLLMQTGYWGRAAMDPEPGRCRRTDGKKWRCSRDAVGAGKYCDRHMHRGRNRSRKPVESAVAAAGGGDGGGGMLRATGSSTVTVASGGGGGGAGFHFAFGNGLSPSVDQLQLNQRSLETSMVERQNGDEAKSGQVLRPFFDDWPPQQNDRANTNLSIAISGNNAASDFALKLSTGDEVGLDRNHSSWPAQWGSSHVSSSSMGGPLAEALRLSTSTSSPTSVLHQLQRGCPASELTS